MMFSKQRIFCNACGKEFSEIFSRVIGRQFKVCSMECMDEIEWRDALSIMGEPYRPQNTLEKKDGNKETK